MNIITSHPQIDIFPFGGRRNWDSTVLLVTQASYGDDGIQEQMMVIHLPLNSNG